jgi:hypothetical protein
MLKKYFFCLKKSTIHKWMIMVQDGWWIPISANIGLDFMWEDSFSSRKNTTNSIVLSFGWIFHTNQPSWMNSIPLERTLTSWIDFQLLQMIFHHLSTVVVVQLLHMNDKYLYMTAKNRPWKKIFVQGRRISSKLADLWKIVWNICRQIFLMMS